MRTLSLRRALRATLLLPLAVLAACDVPSSAPIFQQTWIMPGDSVAVGASTLLPAGVTISGGGVPSFIVSTPAANINTTLGALCGQAACQSGVVVSAPVPAFSSGAGALSTTIAFPAGVSSAVVTGGTITIAVANSLGFDPLRPNGASAPFGSLQVVITSGGTTATTTITGTAAVGIATAATTNFPLTLPLGTYAASIAVAMTLTVPAGASASLQSSNALAVAASLQGFAISQATVVLNNKAITTTPTLYDLGGVDFADQVEGGGLLLDILNPFTATGALNVVLSAPAVLGGPGAVLITKPINIPAQPTSSVTLTLTKPELQSLLGRKDVSVGVSGTVNGTGAGNTIIVTPTSAIKLRTQLQLILNVGA